MLLFSYERFVTHNKRKYCMNINDKTDDEIKQIALPVWETLIEASIEGDYDKFIENFSPHVLLNINQQEAADKFVKDELTRSLSKEYDFLGLLRRGQTVTCLFKVRSTARDGEWLGRMVIGDDAGEIKIFASSIF